MKGVSTAITLHARFITLYIHQKKKKKDRQRGRRVKVALVEVFRGGKKKRGMENNQVTPKSPASVINLQKNRDESKLNDSKLPRLCISSDQTTSSAIFFMTVWQAPMAHQLCHSSQFLFIFFLDILHVNSAKGGSVYVRIAPFDVRPYCACPGLHFRFGRVLQRHGHREAKNDEREGVSMVNRTPRRINVNVVHDLWSYILPQIY